VGIGVPGIRLSAEEVRGLGKELSKGTKVVHEIQDGKGGYVAMLEVFHMLHCLVSEATSGDGASVVIANECRTSCGKRCSTTGSITERLTAMCLLMMCKCTTVCLHMHRSYYEPIVNICTC
jgi:hypothetical protein